jgi:hypothetical protein
VEGEGGGDLFVLEFAWVCVFLSFFHRVQDVRCMDGTG